MKKFSALICAYINICCINTFASQIDAMSDIHEIENETKNLTYQENVNDIINVDISEYVLLQNKHEKIAYIDKLIEDRKNHKYIDCHKLVRQAVDTYILFDYYKHCYDLYEQYQDSTDKEQYLTKIQSLAEKSL